MNENHWEHDPIKSSKQMNDEWDAAWKLWITAFTATYPGMPAITRKVIEANNEKMKKAKA